MYYYTYHCWEIDFSGHLDICKLCLSGYFVCSEALPQAYIIPHTCVAILWGMVVGIYKTWHQKLAGRREEGRVCVCARIHVYIVTEYFGIECETVNVQNTQL